MNYLNFENKSQNTFDNEWKDIVKSQLKGIRIFAKILSDLVKHNKEIFDGRVGERRQVNRLEEVSSDLKNMIEPIADKVFTLLGLLNK